MSLGGCGEEPVVTAYDIPKEYDKAALIWKTPEGWIEDATVPGPNAASFIIQGKDGQVGKVAAMPFGAEVTMLDVANMFGRELGLGLLSKEAIAQRTEKKELGALEFEIVRLGFDENSTEQQRSVTIALHPGKREAWLLMMIAEPRTAVEQYPEFEQFLRSLTVFESREDLKEEQLDSFLHPTIPTTSQAPFDPPAVQKPEWTTPEGWEEQSATGPRVATFGVKGDGEAELDISVTTFPGSMGGPLANLNRWRRQLELDAITEDQLADYAKEREVGGRPALLVDLKNGDRGMLAAMILSEEASWFVKAVGNASLTENQKANFEAFLDSIRFPAP